MAVPHLGVVLRSGKEGQLVGCGEVGSNLLHLPKALPLSPLGSAVLEPDLQDKAAGCRGQAVANQPLVPPTSSRDVFVEAGKGTGPVSLGLHPQELGSKIIDPEPGRGAAWFWTRNQVFLSFRTNRGQALCTCDLLLVNSLVVP